MENEQLTFLLQKILLGQAKIDERLANIERALTSDPWTQGREYDEFESEIPF
jgi:hypothetical protein